MQMKHAYFKLSKFQSFAQLQKRLKYTRLYDIGGSSYKDVTYLQHSQIRLIMKSVGQLKLPAKKDKSNIFPNCAHNES